MRKFDFSEIIERAVETFFFPLVIILARFPTILTDPNVPPKCKMIRGTIFHSPRPNLRHWHPPGPLWNRNIVFRESGNCILPIGPSRGQESGLWKVKSCECGEMISMYFNSLQSWELQTCALFCFLFKCLNFLGAQVGASFCNFGCANG